MKKILTFAALAISASISFSAYAGGSVEAGKAAVAKFGCGACHGMDFKSPIDPSYPKLAGQHADYIEHALTAYQRGGDGPNGRSNAIMGGQAKALSDQDKKDIAAYIHSLPGPLVVRK
jgi:cytochrome c553